MSKIPSASEAFGKILGNIIKEDYERCASSAFDFLKSADKSDDEYKSYNEYRPYAIYFKLFAEAYRTWQISYHYTQIRSNFNLAAYLLTRKAQELFGNPLPTPHDKLIEIFQFLSEMLCSYTRCENSFINNDPLALVASSAEALEIEKKALDILKALVKLNHNYIKGPFYSIAKWLWNYFVKNQLLHEGLNACGNIYAKIFCSHHCEKDFFDKNMRRAENAFSLLSPDSPELSSELNAHILIIKDHYDRLKVNDLPITFLRLMKGKIVLLLSAGCSINVVKSILNDSKTLANFKTKISKEFRTSRENLNFRPLQLQDIFETSFGVHFLKTLAFDLPQVKLTFAGDDQKEYIFDTSVSLSALGVCTISFNLSVDEGLSIEEIRAIQSCICPHAGQVELKFESLSKDPSEKHVPYISKFRFLERLDFPDVLTNLDKIEIWLKGAKDLPRKMVDRLKNEINNIRPDIDKMIKFSLGNLRESSISSEKKDMPFLSKISKIIDTLQKLTQHLIATDASKEMVKAVNDFLSNLLDDCNSYKRVTDIAQNNLGKIENVFRHIAADIPPDVFHVTSFRTSLDEYSRGDRVWLLSPDSGWYTYIYATAIQEVNVRNEVIKDNLKANDILKHGDATGLLIEQREARASFDDWRFMKSSNHVKENLAYIRSHSTDIFFVSEYQAFLYFHDDPQFLVDQYETTVELVNRLDASITFYNSLSESMSEQLNKELENVDINASKIKAKQISIKSNLTAISQVQWECNEMRNLISKTKISRYKDHGELMTRIIENMKLDKKTELLDRHLSNICDLHNQVLDRLKELKSAISAKNIRRLNNRTSMLAAFIGAVATKSFVEAIFKSPFIQKESTKYCGGMNCSNIESILTITLILMCFGLGFYYNYKNIDD